MESNFKLCNWYLVDASDVVLGRLSSLVSLFLIGKNKVDYSPNKPSNNHVVIINSEKICVTGKKFHNKFYYRHSGYIGGIKKINYCDLLEKFPNKILFLSIKGMLPKNRLRKIMLKRLKIYSGPTHPHFSQNPVLLKV